jgi:DNA topoisomerase-1
MEKKKILEKLPNVKNTPYLIIVESPSKCKKIENYMGFQYKCIASKGHIRSLSKIKKKTENYEPIFEIIPEKQKHVDFMRKVIALFDTSNIFLATDDDREGEAIAWHICETFHLSIENTHRILFREITETAVRQSFLQPTKIRMNVVFAQHARQILDQLVGFKISPVITKLVSRDNHYLSAGRCQTPALRLIYDNEIERKKNPIEIVYDTVGFFFRSRSSTIIPLKCKLSHSFQTILECKSFLEESIDFSHQMSMSELKIKTQTAPIAFHTSGLLQYVSNHLQLSPKEIMKYCQELYQEGYITYMRTESTKYSHSFLQKMEIFLKKEYMSENMEMKEKNEIWFGDKTKLENINETNPHEAIRVTNLETKKIEIECKKKADIYEIIWKRTVESCMSDYVYKTSEITLNAPKEYQYQTSIEVPVFLGWKRVSISEKTHRENQMKQHEFYSFLYTEYQSSILQKKRIECVKIECKAKIETSKSHYTESGLIHQLELLGIGRPSTFSFIVDTIQERGYVKKQDIPGEIIKCTDMEICFFDLIERKKQKKNVNFNEKEIEKTFGKEKNKLILQPLGKKTIEELIGHFESLFSYDFTKSMENKLDQIMSGEKKEWYEICKECDNTINENMLGMKKKLNKTYKIDEEHEFVFMKTGGVIKKINIDGTSEYKSIKSDLVIDVDRLCMGNYTLEELLEIPKEYLGDYEGKPVHLKKSRYGIYVSWNDSTKNLDTYLFSCKKTVNQLSLEDIIQFLKEETKVILSKRILRVITPELSIRNGKYGAYIFFKPKEKKTPQFFHLKLFPENYISCSKHILIEWIEKSYGIQIQKENI